MAAIYCQVKYSLKLGMASLHRDPVGQKFCRNRSSTVFKIQAFLCFVFLKKIQNGRHFLASEYSLKLGKASIYRNPVGLKFCRNRSIWHSFQDTSIFVIFAKN